MKEGLKLTEVKDQHLHIFVHRGKANARSITRARIVLKLDEAAFRRQVGAVETERNAQRRGICWQFTSCDARHKLERLYPVKVDSAD